MGPTSLLSMELTMAAASRSRLREHLRKLDRNLFACAERLWEESRHIHEFQNRPGDLTENGRFHVETVERNIWRLLSAKLNPDEKSHLGSFSSYEIFLLSAGACCHDFDKAAPSLGFKHGEGSARIVTKMATRLGLDRFQARDVGDVVEVHGTKKAGNFRTHLDKLSTTHQPSASSYPVFDLRRLVVVLTAADILHLDHTRIVPAMRDMVGLSALKGVRRRAYLARSCTRGWHLSGDEIVVLAEPENPQVQNAFLKCIGWMLENEWRCVEDGLRTHGFPYRLKEGIGQVENKKGRDRMRIRKVSLEGDRFLTTGETRSFILSALEGKQEYPICRHEAACHAAGSAVASFAMRALLDRIESFTNAFKTRTLEFIREVEYNPRQLSMHITSLSQASALLANILNEEDKRGVLKKAFQSTKDSKRIYRNLNETSNQLRRHIYDMYKKYREIAADIAKSGRPNRQMERLVESNEWSPEINKLYGEKRVALFDVCGRLSAGVDELKRVGRSVNRDWRLDLDQTWKGDNGQHCPPHGMRA